MSDIIEQTPAKEAEAITLAEFYESTPPGQLVVVTDLFQWDNGHAYLRRPDITLYCGTKDLCEGPRQYTTSTMSVARGTSWQDVFVAYLCRNCSKSIKNFAIRYLASLKQKPYSAHMFKYGEIPNFGPPTAPRLTRLLGSDKDLFLKGRRAENQGMGIAAFAYYRRVIESQKDAIFDEIIRVSKGIAAGPAIVAGLEEAKKQVQFTNAVDEVKDGIPPALFINGHNPLTLMHSALSEGLHAQTDEQCLTLATDLRVVMADFVDRMAQTLKDNAELHTSVSRLLNRKQLKLSNPTAPSVSTT
jgi:hypothetical protein